MLPLRLLPGRRTSLPGEWRQCSGPGSHTHGSGCIRRPRGASHSGAFRFLEPASVPPLVSEVASVRTYRNGYKSWSPTEDDILRCNYGDPEHLSRLLPERTIRSIKARAGRLGIDRGYREWTTKEIAILIRMRGTHKIRCIVAELPSRSHHSVALKCLQLRLWRRKRKPTITGDTLLDEVRLRAYDLKYSMLELDDAACTRPYFSRDCLVRPRNYKALMKAILFLGGKFYWDN